MPNCNGALATKPEHAATRADDMWLMCHRPRDRYIRARARHAQAWRPHLWLGTRNRGPLTASGIYQMIARRGRQCGVDVFPYRFGHHFSHTWLDRGSAEGDLMELNGWASPQ